ncbi:dTMP kinase [Candidatus Kaiserbacteria bacterium]|nr:dTMP kinase [Candidatus Kaiserbacteria bacterium]
MRGKFIVLEGGEGSGKTTIGERLKVEFPEIVYTQDPGGTRLGEQVRQILMDDASSGMDVRAELLLFLAGRAQLVAEVIEPSLGSGKNVVSNRFGLSTIAYQVYGRERPELLELFRTVSPMLTGKAQPDACILLDVTPETGAARVHSRPEEPTRFDKEALDFHARVREGLKKHVGEFGAPYLVDAEKPLEEVWTDVKAIVQSTFQIRV